jgi:ABC-type antimicrobial peptide transport system permease subunit
VVRLFVLEGLALGAVSAVVGAAVGGAIVLSLAATGISMKVAALSIVALSTVAALYPAFTASRLEPREALQRA